MVATSGVNDSQWEGTCVKDTGGIITVHSGLGEPIHFGIRRILKPFSIRTCSMWSFISSFSDVNVIQSDNEVNLAVPATVLLNYMKTDCNSLLVLS